MAERRISPLNGSEPERRGVPVPVPPEPPTDLLQARIRALAITTLLIGVALGAGVVMEHLLKLPNILLVFLPVVLFAAVRFGLLAASWASVLSVLATSFFLAPPTMSFDVADASNVWALIIFLAVAIVTSSLAAQVRQRAAAADRHAQIVEALYEFGSKLGAISDEDELLYEALRQIDRMLHVSAVLLVPRRGVLRTVAIDPQAATLSVEARRAAEWCWQTASRPGTARAISMV